MLQDQRAWLLVFVRPEFKARMKRKPFSATYLPLDAIDHQWDFEEDWKDVC
jgi:hypothetical protein